MKTTSQKKDQRAPEQIRTSVSAAAEQPAPAAAAVATPTEHIDTRDGRGNLPPIDSEARKQNRILPTDKVLSLLHTVNPDLFNLAEVVGKWVWVQFKTEPAPTLRQQLAQLGFHWNRERQAWQHPCGAFRLRGAGDPHQRYVSYFPADQQTA